MLPISRMWAVEVHATLALILGGSPAVRVQDCCPLLSDVLSLSPMRALVRMGGLLSSKALASGTRVTDIAAAEGIGRTLAPREANWPECRQLRTRIRKRRTRRNAVVLPIASHDRACSQRQARLYNQGRADYLWRTRSLRLAATKHIPENDSDEILTQSLIFGR